MYASIIYHENVHKLRDEIKEGPIRVSTEETTKKVGLLAM